MDYFGRWKALMYYTKRFYSPTLISPYVDEAGNLSVSVVSDSPYPKAARMTLTLMDLTGKTLTSKGIDVNVEPLKGKSYFAQPVSEFLNGADDKNAFLLAELEIDGRIVSRNEYFFKPFKELSLSRPNIATTVAKSADGFKIALSTDKVAKSVYLSGFSDGFFSDNYFNLIPGRTVELNFRANATIGVDEFRRRLRVRSLIDAFD
jgi:beta-mannosidase